MAAKNPKKGSLYSKADKDLRIDFTFNPKEFTVDKSNQYKEQKIPGLPASILQFVKGDNRTLSMDLFFDTYEERIDVRTYTDIITGWDAGAIQSKLSSHQGKGLMDLTSKSHDPPICIFEWGRFTFECVIEKATKQFTLFLDDGTPVRATVKITLKEYRPVELYVKEAAKESADLTKRRVVIQGDSLWAISASEYGKSSDWRLIAEANKIDNPRILEPGTELILPLKE